MEKDKSEEGANALDEYQQPLRKIEIDDEIKQKVINDGRECLDFDCSGSSHDLTHEEIKIETEER